MCPISSLMSGSALQDLPSDSPAACRSACRRQASPRTGSLPTNDPRAHPAYPGRATRSSWPLPNHLPTTTARSKPTPRLAQHRLRQLRAPGSQLRQTTSRAWTQRATTPTPAISAVRRPAHRRAPGPHFGRTQRTRQRTDTGRRHRAPDSGHLDAQTPAPDTGHRSRGQASVDTGRSHRTPDTGHRTLAEDADRVTKARPASGPPGPPRRATARWDAQPCSCGRRLRRSAAHTGSAVRPPSSAR
jgi:hypothetical protein